MSALTESMQSFYNRLWAKTLSMILPPKVLCSKDFFRLWESKGYHITPVHYFQPVPDTRELPPDIFERESALAGIDMRERDQLALLERFCAQYREEYATLGEDAATDPLDFHFDNGSFETVDAEMLYCMVRHHKPRNIIEIGSGYSTRVAAAAIRRNTAEDAAYRCDVKCVEPFPMDWIGKIPEVSEVIVERVENLPLETFATLGENDILFIDSTHIIKIYNDVCFEYLDVLPTLNRGVLVHIHDIILPKRYAENWYGMKHFWNEQYLLQAFLAFNQSFRVLWAGQYMHLRHPQALAESFPSYPRAKQSESRWKQRQGHKSFWMQRVG